MTSYSGTFTFYNSFRENIGKSINLATDSFKMILVGASYEPDSLAHSVLSDISGEVSGSGYSRQTLSSVSFELDGSRSVFDFDDVIFEASGGSWSAKRFIIYDDSVSDPIKPLVGYGYLRTDGNSITVSDGNTLTFQTPSGGLFDLG